MVFDFFQGTFHLEVFTIVAARFIVLSFVYAAGLAVSMIAVATQ